MQKRVIFWQKASFHTFAGGDGLYLHKLKLFFISVGWEVVTITSHVHRPYLYVSSRYYLPNSPSKIRGAFRFGRWYLFSPVTILTTTANYLSAKIVQIFGLQPKQKTSPVETEWAKNEIIRSDADLVIKCFDKFGHDDFLEIVYKKGLHLVGFMNNDEYIFSDNNIVKNDSLVFDLTSSFAIDDRVCNSNPPAIGFSSKFDRDRLRRHFPRRDSIYIGIGFESRFKDIQSRMNHAVFVGNKTTLNKFAVEHLINKIWPLVLKSVPDARLRVIGRVCDYFEGGHINVDLLGEVDDLDAEYWNCKVVVAPLLVGSAGVKTKVAEGLAYGRVVVTTSLGVDASDPGQLQGAAFVEDEPVQFSEIVSKLLLDDELRTAIEAKTRDVFERNYSAGAAYVEIAEWLGIGI